MLTPDSRKCSAQPCLRGLVCAALLALFGTAGFAEAETYHYDLAGRLTQAAYSDGTTLGFVYDTRGNLVTRLASAAGTDSDSDGLPDSEETGTGKFVNGDDTGTNPASADTDGDGADDGDEVAAGTDPTDSSDTPSVAIPALGTPALAILACLLAAAALLATRMRRPGKLATWLIATMLVTSGAREALGHGCGPTPVNVGVGDTKIYQITADVDETEESGYNQAFNDDPSVALVEPASSVFFNEFQAGRFHITGLAPGTANLMLMWDYAPNFVSGICNVVVNVVDESEAPPRTAANNSDSGEGGDPVNTFTGELVQGPIVDLDLGGPMPLRFARAYASGIARDGKIRGGLGNGWLHNFDLRMLEFGSNVEIVFLWGRILEFTPDGGGGWDLQQPLDVSFQLVDDGSDRVLFDPRSQTRFRFDDQGRLASITDRNDNALSLSYDNANLSGVSDGLGRQLTLTFAGEQDIATVSDGTRTVSYSVDGTFGLSAGNLTQVIDARGQTTSYTYTPPYPAEDPFARMMRGPDPSYQLSRVRPEGNIPYSQTWDSSGRAVTQTNARGGTTTFTWGSGTTILSDPLGNSVVDNHDSDGDITSQIDAAVQTSTLVYDTAGRRQSLTDRDGNVTAYSYDASSGNVASVTRADGSATTVTYAESTDALGFSVDDRSRVDHPDGTFETFVRDANGNVTSHTARGGEVSSFTYNAVGQVASASNALGGTANYGYNADGTLASHTTPAGDTTGFGYDALRRLTTLTLSDGNTATTSYDDGDLVTGTTDPAGSSASTNYDDNGRPTLLTNRLGHTTTLTWDAMDRVANVADPLGNTATVNYDMLDRVASVANAAGEITTFGRDAVGRVTSVTDAGGEVWTRSYDAEGLLASKVDPLGHSIGFTRDSLGRLTRVTSPMGLETDLAYDNMGRLTTLADGLDRATTYDHDDNGRVDRIDLPGAVAGSDYARNGLGQVTQVTDPGGHDWNFAYDNQGRPTSATDPLGFATSLTYDTRSRVSGVTFPDSLGTIAHSYDPNGNLVQALYSDATDLGFSYDALDRIISADGVTRSFDAAGRMTESNGLGITYDAANRISSILYAPAKSVSFSYDARGRLASVSDWVGEAMTFAYDDAGRLETVARANGVGTGRARDSDGRVTALDHGTLASVDLDYDAAGQVVAASRTGPQATATPATGMATRSFNTASRDEATSHDALGRLTQDGTTTYTWDLASRLVEIDAAGEVVALEYDDLGRRTSRSEGGTTRNFTWNDALGLASIAIESEGGTPERYYVHAPGGALLYSIDPGDDSRHFYHFDETGNAVLLTDDAGAVVQSYAYSPYGQVTAESGGLDQPFTWQGQLGVMQEGGDGLYYSRARYYDAPRARFLSHDPLTNLGPRGHNPYQYAYQNPLTFSDPSGKLPKPPDDPFIEDPSAAFSYGTDGTSSLLKESQFCLEARSSASFSMVDDFNRADLGVSQYRLAQSAESAADLAKAASNIGRAFQAGGAVGQAVSEFANDKINSTTVARAGSAISVGGIDLAVGASRAGGLAMLASQTADLAVSVTVGEEYRPGLHEPLFNVARIPVTVGEELLNGGGALQRFEDAMATEQGLLVAALWAPGKWVGDNIVGRGWSAVLRLADTIGGTGFYGVGPCATTLENSGNEP